MLKPQEREYRVRIVAVQYCERGIVIDGFTSEENRL